MTLEEIQKTKSRIFKNMVDKIIKVGFTILVDRKAKFVCIKNRNKPKSPQLW